MRDPLEKKVPRSERESFRVIPDLNEAGEEVYMVVAPTGVRLYMFENIHDAAAEVAELNSTANGSNDARRRLHGRPPRPS